MDAETRTRLRHIRDATNINKKYFSEQERRRTEQYEHSRQRIKAKFYVNKNINYRKHAGL